MSDERLKLRRRTLLQLLPASLLAKDAEKAAVDHVGVDHCGMPVSATKAEEPYRFKFFAPDEVDLFNLVAEQIIPADEHSPGAREAKVVEFADLMISTSAEYVRTDWRTGLHLVAEQLKQSDIHAFLDQVSQQEEDPQTVLEVFYPMMKQMTINGYYSSAVGIHQDLQYQGNTYLTSFQGCDHPEHQG